LWPAIAFQKHGYHVFATARNPEKMSKLRGLPNVSLLTLDVLDPTHIADAVDFVAKETGGTLSYLVNNAGRNHYMPLLDDNTEDGRRIYDTNVWGPMAVTREFAPLLIKAEGTLVFITSVGEYVDTPYMGEDHLPTTTPAPF
jgi:NAD(P)-dependent dehydrogenase (short-subunit alcohol dehydrogenase family)